MTKIVVSQAQLKYVPPAELVADPQVRQDAAFTDDQELVRSVATYGVRQPIAARRLKDGRLHIVHGHRRVAAAKAAGLPSVPVIVEQIAEEELTALQLIENLQRTDLSLRDTAFAVRKLYNEHGAACLVADMLQKPRSWVSKMLTLPATGNTSTTIAGKLLEADKLGDLELAYMMCRLEAKDAGKAAELAAILWANKPLSRKQVQDALNAADRKEQAADDGDTEAEAPAATPKVKTVTVVLTIDEARLLHRALDQAVVAPDLAGVKIGLLAKLK
jgi:ParB/RepB/Spo0J family partition protein